MYDETIRLIYVLLGLGGFGWLVARLIGSWDDLPSLGHWLGGLLASTILLSAIATWRANALHAPINEFIYVLMLHRVLCIWVAWRWPGMLANRLKSPYR